MDIKDFIYLALIALAGAVFYCHGLYAGLVRGRKEFEALLKNLGPTALPPEPKLSAPQSLPVLFHEPKTFFTRPTRRGGFGDN